MIVGDAPLEAALGKKKVHVNEIRGVVQQQLMLVEASQGPLSARMLAGAMVSERAARSNPPASSISQIIVTLTLLLASAGPTNGFLAYSCDKLRSTVAGYALTPEKDAGWSNSPTRTRINSLTLSRL